MSKEIDLSVNIGGIRMKNPVMPASGVFGYGIEFKDLYRLEKLGAFATKAITLKPREGYEGIRIVETRAGILNAIGLANVGVEALISEKLPKLREFDTPVIVNIAGRSIDEYIEITKRLNDQEGVAGLEVNISCPTVSSSGLAFGTDPRIAHDLTSRVCKAATNLPIIVKLSPNVTNIGLIARSVVEAGANAISLINTLTGMAIDIHTCKPKLANVIGGLSGPAIKPVAVSMVWRCYETVCKKENIPIVGMGGIEYWEDAVEFILAGATAVGIGTAVFVDPETCHKIIRGLRNYLENNGKYKSIKDLVGKVELDSKSI